MTSQTKSTNTDFEMSNPPQRERSATIGFYFRFLSAGVIFGILLVKSEVISWFRIQEMFRLQSFHMFGVIGSAVFVGIISILIIKKLRLRTLDGEPIHFVPRRFHKGNVIGGLIFGFGWALTGACPGPLYAQIGTGALVVFVTLLSAVVGTWLYGYFQSKLPH
ncbi:MAG TPA: DUF6691 family protein [Ohtaekwangia sp.]|nr:DUF6691 family protein [Ohtaekwangia sp.]